MSRRRAIVLLSCLAVLTACDQQMADAPRYDPQEPAEIFPNGSSARPPVSGTVTRGAVLMATPESIPYEIDMAFLERGQERFNIFCSPCHGRDGDGRGMIVERGFPSPPSYHLDALRNAPDRHFYDVITNGYGAMYSYAARVPPRDRWAIVAYIRALQLSRHAPADELPAALLARLKKEPVQ